MVPGSSIVFAGGILAGLGVLEPWQAAAFAIAGAVLGDAASYELGRFRRDTILSWWPLRTHPEIIGRGQAYFEKGGAKAVMLGRFLGPLRAIVPLVAGIARMPPRHFYPVNVLSAIGWAAAHLVPGILFGASLELAGAISARLVALVAVVVASLWLVTRAIKLALRIGWPHVVHLRVRLERYVADPRRPFARPLARLLDPRHHAVALLVSAALLVFGAWLFLGVVEDVVTRDTLVDVDRSIYGWLQSVRTEAGDAVMVTITELGSAIVMIAVVGVVALWLGITRRVRTLGYWLAAAIVGQALVFGLKYALGRARPESALGVVDGYSFPSGHAAQSLVVFGFLAFLLGHGKSASQKTLFAGSAIAIALLVAFSRIYLGAHWFSDVVASFGLATAWVALLAMGYIENVREPRLRAAPVLVLLLGTLVFVGGTYVARHHARDLRVYARSTPRPQLALDAWREGGFAALPAARTEIAGRHEEPFTLQWAATREALIDALGAAQWTSPSRWESSAILLWLLPSTPVARLPVVPKFDHGEPPTLTFIRAESAHERLVVRLWIAADVVDASNQASAVQAERAARHVFVGMITRERSHTEWALVSVTRTVARDVPPTSALERALRGWRSEGRVREDGTRVLLAWREAQSRE